MFHYVCYFFQEEERQGKKIIQCRYCGGDIISTNFARHLERNHLNTEEVQNVFQYPKESKQRRQAFALIRNSTNFELFIKGITRATRQLKRSSDNIKCYPCVYCKGVFAKAYLNWHSKKCIMQEQVYANENPNRKNQLSLSHTVTACAMDITDTLSKLNVKTQVIFLKYKNVVLIDLISLTFRDTFEWTEWHSFSIN